MQSPEQRVAVVTGGSRGIGRAICLELGRSGWSVVVNYATRPDAAQEVVAAIEAMPSRALAVRCDVSQAADRAGLIDQTLERFGRIDMLVSNAGITSPGRKDILEAGEDGWETVFSTNLKGPFFLCQRAANEMTRLIRAGAIAAGKLIVVSSISAYAVSVNRADYCIAKAGLSMMAKLYAQRLADDGIQVFEICPGVIASDMTAAVTEKYDRLIADGLWPIRRWGQPEDVAKAVAAIAGDSFPFSTGCRFDIDGGFHIRSL